VCTSHVRTATGDLCVEMCVLCVTCVSLKEGGAGGGGT